MKIFDNEKEHNAFILGFVLGLIIGIDFILAVWPW